MALVARGHATLRCAIVRRAETSGPPQEARHTCSGVCVPIIRSACPLPPPPFPLFPFSFVPLPVLSLLPTERSRPTVRSIFDGRGRKKSEHIAYM